MNTRKPIIIGLMVSCVVAGAAIAQQPSPPAAASAQAPIPPARYQVIADMATMEQQIADLQRDMAATREDLRDAQGQIGALMLLRAHDIELANARRVADSKRLASVEWNVNTLWSVCK
jgi:hypothetical protein